MADDQMTTRANPARVPKDARQPFGSTTQKLAYPPRPGFHRHWFNDDPGRIDMAVAAGYTHVIGKDGQRVCRVVGVTAGGGPLQGYLMEIPEEWYQEDMARQNAETEKTMDAVRRGAIAGQPGVDGRYIPEATPIRVSKGGRPS